MWRRIIYFFVLLGGGLAVLSLILGPENLFDLSPVREERTHVGPSSEVRVDSGRRPGQGAAGTPQSVGVQIEGGIEDLRREYQVTLPSGKKRVLLLYQLSAEDVEPSNVDRSYVMRGVRIWFHRRIGSGEELRSIPVVRLDARQMIAFLDAEGGALRIDESQDLLARDIEIYASPSGLRGDGAVPERFDPRDLRLRVLAPRLRAEVGEDRVRMRAPPDAGRMRIDVESRDQPLQIDGRGFLADLPVDFEENAARSGSEGEPSASTTSRGLPSRITLDEDVTVRGLGPVRRGASPWRVTGDGPMHLDESSEGGMALQLSGSVALRGFLGASKASVPSEESVLLTGEHLFAWLGRGRIDGGPDGRVLVAPELRALRITGAEAAPAALLHSDGTLRAGVLDVQLDAFGELSRVVATGLPELRLAAQGRNGESSEYLVACDERIRWDRRHAGLRPVLAGLGFDALRPVLGLVRQPFPSDLFRFEGRTLVTPIVVEEKKVGGLRSLECSEGLLVRAQRLLGRLEVTEWHGFGEVTGQAETGEGPYRFSGDSGFVATRTPLSGRLDFVLGRSVQRSAAALRLLGPGIGLSGRGHLQGSASLEPAGGNGVRARSGRVHFEAAEGSRLQALRSSVEHPFRMEGVERVSVRFADGRVLTQDYRGTGLELLAPELRAVADRVQRVGSGPWTLERKDARVELKYSVPEQQASLFARRVEIQPLVRPWPLRGGFSYVFAARGRVQLRSTWLRTGRSLEVDADQLRHDPELHPAWHDPLAGVLLGPGTASWQRALALRPGREKLKEPGGLWFGEGNVRLAMREIGEEGAPAIREFYGHQVRVLGSGQAARLRSLEGGLVRGFVQEPTVLRCLVEGKELVTRGSSFELRGPAPHLWLAQGADGPGPTRRVFLRPSGRITIEGEVLRLPGPVVISSEESEGEPAFELRSGGDVRIRFDREQLTKRAKGNESETGKKIASRFGMPPEILELVAEGGVEFERGELQGTCDRLELDPRSGWSRLQAAPRESVRVQWEGGLLVDTWPGVELQLETLEMRGGSGRLFHAPPESAREKESANSRRSSRRRR